MQLLRTLARGGVTPVTRRTIPIAAPAAAAGWTLTPDNGRAWEVLSVSTSLVTDANVASRGLTLALGDGSATLWTVPALGTQAASTTVGYSWHPHFPYVAVSLVADQLPNPLPTVVLLPGWSLTLAVANAQAADQVGATRVQVLETFVGDTAAEYDLARVIVHHAEAFALAVEGEVSGA